jgi:dTDP-4-dehydrorhamnose reductase
LLDRAALDITSVSACRRAIEQCAPDVVMNCAAYTAVDRAETERDLAFAVNANAPRYLADAASAAHAHFVHFSTDYVFDGQSMRPYIETDTTAPLGVYGESKLAGEHAVAAVTDDYLIFRLSWVYSNDGGNFYKTMLRLASERDQLRVVSDQYGIPNFTVDIADAIAHVISRDRTFLRERAGVYHLSAQGVTNWYEFATEIVRNAQLPRVPAVEAIPTSSYPTPAKRPAYSALNSSRFAATFGVNMPHWKTGLMRCLAERDVSA